MLTLLLPDFNGAEPAKGKRAAMRLTGKRAIRFHILQAVAQLRVGLYPFSGRSINSVPRLVFTVLL